MTHSIEYYRYKINLLRNRGKENYNIIRKLERKIRKMERETAL